MNEIRKYWEEATPMNFADEKWSYEKKRTFRYELQSHMHETFGFENWKGKKVLEVGCGSGIDALEFARNGALVTAVDITENACALTRALAMEAGVPIEVLQINSTLPFAEGTFDLVYSFGVLHHIPNVEGILNEIHRVLKPDGKIAAMLYNRDSLLFAYSIVYLHGLKDKVILDGFSIAVMDKLLSRYSERIEGCPYTKAYTKTEARELFERCFTDVTIDVRYNVIDTPQQRKVKLDVDDIYELGWHLIVKGTKGEVHEHDDNETLGL